MNATNPSQPPHSHSSPGSAGADAAASGAAFEDSRLSADERAHVEVRVLSQPRYLAGVREMMTALAERLGMGEGAASQVALAVDEALCNVIRHGYDQRPDGEIVISVWPVAETPRDGADRADSSAEASAMLIRIDDRGKQTEPERIRSRELSEIRPGGLGVHIIKEVMDSVRYEKRSGGGMRLTMVKSVWPSAEAGTGGRPSGGGRSGPESDGSNTSLHGAG